MAKSSCLGMPHIGAHGEICDAIPELIKSNFKGKKSFDLMCSEIRKANIKTQIEIGIDHIPCNDFTVYDNVLDTTTLVGNIPRKYYWEGGIVPLDIYFSMIKGQQKDKFDVHGMSSYDWFNTGFSCIVPEISNPLNFAYSDNKPISHFLEAKKNFNISPVITLLGPVSYIMFGYNGLEDDTTLPSQSSVINKLMNVYSQLFQNLRRLNATQIRFEEPFLVRDLTREEQATYKECYAKLHELAKDDIEIHITTCYGSLGNNLECTMSLGTKSVHYDIINGKDDLDNILNALPNSTMLSLGIVDANDIWITDLEKAISIAEKVQKKIGNDRVIISTSSSLAYCPLDKNIDTEANKIYKPYLSFAINKLREVKLITKALNEGRESIKEELDKNKKLIKSFDSFCTKIDKDLDKSISSNKNKIKKRAPFAQRKELQISNLKKSLLPMTDFSTSVTDSSLHKSLDITEGLKSAILENVRLQERYLDIVNAGEIERRTNIEYFGKLIDGVDSTNAKISRTSGMSYIARPTIYSVSEKVDKHYIDIAKYCLSVVTKPLKFSLIGPISMVNCSFIPKNIDIFKFYTHFAHIIGKQIQNLQEIGIKYITIDEPNLLQKMPLRSEYVNQYIKRIGEIFKIASGYAQDDVQISLQIRGTPLTEYIESISCLDPDVLFIGSAESKFEILNAFVSYKYPNDIALGMFNSKSSRIPTKSEIYSNIKKSLRVLEEDQLWITTDNGVRGRTRKEITSIYSTIASIVQETRKSLK